MIDLFLNFRFQFISVFGSIFAILFVVELIRRRKIKEEYSLLWLFLGFSFLAMSLSQTLINKLADMIGIAYSPAALLLFLILGCFAILIHYSAVITKITIKNKDLVQELSILKYEFEEFKTKLEAKEKGEE
jgi:hypothetical protein